MNWDPRSAHLNTEMAVVIEQPNYIEESLLSFESALRDNAYELKMQDGDIVWKDHVSGAVYTSEPHAGILRRMGATIAGWLPIEEQL